MKPYDIESLAAHIEGLPATNGKILVAVVGAPGSGKSTFSKQLGAVIGASCVVIPMDGYHLKNETLTARHILHKKGAPETFDVEALLDLVKKVSLGENPSFSMFDRKKDAVIENADIVLPSHDIVIFEGNYLLLDESKWAALQDYWTLTIFLDIKLETVKQRLIERWVDHGLSYEAAVQRAIGNDLKNANIVINRSASSDIVIDSNAMS